MIQSSSYRPNTVHNEYHVVPSCRQTPSAPLPGPTPGPALRPGLRGPRVGRLLAALVAVLVLASARAQGSICAYYATPPSPPAQGAVLWVKHGGLPGPTAPNTLVVDFNEHVPSAGSLCQWNMNDPEVISVAPGGALVFYGEGWSPDGSEMSPPLVSPWGAVNVPWPGAGPINVIPDRYRGEWIWTHTAGVAVVDPAVLLRTTTSCRQCDLS